MQSKIHDIWWHFWELTSNCTESSCCTLIGYWLNSYTAALQIQKYITSPHLSPGNALQPQMPSCTGTNCVCERACACVRANEKEGKQISTHATVAKCIMYWNNESHLCLLTFQGCCLHFTALCINTHGFNNSGSSMVIDPVSHSPPFLISSSAWGSASPMSLYIYMLQLSHKYGGVRGHKVELMALHVANNMDRAQTHIFKWTV